MKNNNKKKNEIEERIIDFLSRSSNSSYTQASDIAHQLGLGAPIIRSAIKTQRKRFINGKTNLRIVTGPRGYSLRQSRTNITHETNLRIAQIAGNMFNGAPVFLKCKKIALNDFNKIQLKYQPKMISLDIK